MVAKMAPNPLIFALANPTPEIMPEEVAGGARRRDHGHRPHRLPEPGQQRPVLPVHLPRRARFAARRRSPTRWRSPRCTRSPSWRRPSRARSWPPPMPARPLSFGPEYLIPKPFDPRLMMQIAPAVAQGRRRFAAWRCGRSPTWTPTASKLQTLRLRLGHDDEADLQRGQARAEQARGLLPRARKSACCARCRWWSTRASRGRR